jgi:hypothetical protein
MLTVRSEPNRVGQRDLPRYLIESRSLTDRTRREAHEPSVDEISVRERLSDHGLTLMHERTSCGVAPVTRTAAVDV